MENQARLKKAEELVEEMGIGHIWTSGEYSLFIYIYFNKKFKGGFIKVDGGGDFDISRIILEHKSIARSAAEKLNFRTYI